MLQVRNDPIYPVWLLDREVRIPLHVHVHYLNAYYIVSRALDVLAILNDYDSSVLCSSEPYPALNVVAKPVCEKHRQCLFNDSDHLLVTWDLPMLNSFLLCPVEQTWLNYSYTELEVEMESFQLTDPNITVTDTSFEIRPVMPGTTYNVTISFVNEVGESLDNTIGMFPHAFIRRNVLKE